MAEDKKSFLAYCDWIDVFEELTNEEAGMLAKHLFRYVNDKNPTVENRIVKLSFIQIQQTLKRDLKKYESYINKQKLNGSKGGRPKKEESKETQITQAFLEKPKKADIDIVIDSEIEKDIVIDNSKISIILNFFDFSSDNPNHIKQQRLVMAFLTTLKDHDYFFTQFEAYKKLKTKEPEFKHSLNNFLGKQSEQFQDGKWMDNNWVEKLKQSNIKNHTNKNQSPVLSLAEKNRAERLAKKQN